MNPNTAHRMVKALVAEGVLVTTPAIGSIVAERQRGGRTPGARGAAGHRRGTPRGRGASKLPAWSWTTVQAALAAHWKRLGGRWSQNLETVLKRRNRNAPGNKRYQRPLNFPMNIIGTTPSVPDALAAPGGARLGFQRARRAHVRPARAERRGQVHHDQGADEPAPQPTGGRGARDGRGLTPAGPEAELANIGYVAGKPEACAALWMTVRQLLDFCRPFYPRWDEALAAKLLAQCSNCDESGSWRSSHAAW